MNLTLRLRLALLCALSLLPATAQRTSSVHTEDGLGLQLRADGTVVGVTAGRPALRLLPAAGGFQLTEYLPPDGSRRELGILRGKLGTEGGAQVLRADLLDAGLGFQARFQGRTGYIDVEGEVADKTGKDRALLVDFRLPLNAEGWLWGDGLERSRRVVAGERYHIDDPLGEKRDIPASRLGFTALSGKDAGVSLAVPAHEPRVFRLFYDEQGYHVSFQLGLSPEVSKDKARATFRFILYRHDPAWGLRSAVQRYYDFFPELFVKRVPRDGGMGFFLRTSYVVPNLEDFAAVFAGVGQGTLTPEQAEVVRRNGLIAFKHREPWAWWHLVRFADNKAQRVPSRLARAGDPPPPTLEEELAIVEKKAQAPPDVLDGNDQIPGPVREVASAAQHCFIYDENNRPRRLLWHLWSTKDGMAWHSQIPLNANPRLPHPNRSDLARKYQFPNMAAWDDAGALHVNGVSFDSLTNWTGFRWEDYRRENFPYDTAPLTFCPRNGRVVQITGFHDWEMVKAWGEEIRSKGRFLMSNTDTQPYLFCGQYLDVMGVERSPDVVTDDEMALVRILCYRKPAFYYREVTEKGMRRCLQYAVFPTVSMVGSSAQAEAARPLYKKYAPLIQKMATAGWQPVTHARVAGAAASFRLERFGDKKGSLFFSVRNSGNAPATAEVVVDLQALGLRAERQLRAAELLERREVTERLEGRALKVNVRLDAGETLVLGL